VIKTPIPTKYSDCYTLSGASFDTIRISEEEARGIIAMKEAVKPLMKGTIAIHAPQIYFKRAFLYLSDITVHWYNDLGVKHDVSYKDEVGSRLRDEKATRGSGTDS
jgi:hypothetical protein